MNFMNINFNQTFQYFYLNAQLKPFNLQTHIFYVGSNLNLMNLAVIKNFCMHKHF
jgi:hypothetical protein